jgi:predicted PurR-regulated permease PerM
MPVILIGALSGMAAAGIVGLFLGAVLLTLGYVLLMDWVAAGDAPAEPGGAASDPGRAAT